MSTYKEILAVLAYNASHAGKGDPLLEVTNGLTIPIASIDFLQFSLDQKGVLKLIDQAKSEEKERGIMPLCLAEKVLSWTYKQQQIQSPLLLNPCDFSIDKVRGVITLVPKVEERFVNPVLQKLILAEYGIELSGTPETIASELFSTGLATIEEGYYLGNFHHHRFDVLRDLEAIQSLAPDENLLELLGETTSEELEASIELSDGFVESSDPDQIAALDAISKRQTVIQGPPGTGKSQVLTNLLAKILHSGNQALVVSEKRVALEVLVKKLRSHGLDRFAFIATDSRQSKEFLAELKENWFALEEGQKFDFVPHDSSSALLGSLQLLLDTLNAPEVAGGLSYAEFLDATQNADLQKGSFDSTLPDLKTWLTEAPIIERIYNNHLTKTVGALQYGALKPEQLQRLDAILRELTNEFERLSGLVQCNTWGELLGVMKLAAAAQYQSSDLYRRHAGLLKKDSPQQKKFLKLRKKYLKLSLELAQLRNDHEANWLKKPTSEEVIMLQNDLKRGGIFAKSRFKRKWSTYSHLPIDQAGSLLVSRKECIDREVALIACRQELFDLGIEEPEVYLEIIFQQISDPSLSTDEQFCDWPEDKVRQLACSNKALSDLHTQLKLVFQFREECLLKELLCDALHQLAAIRQLIAEAPLFSELTHRALGQYGSFEELQLAVFHTNYQQFLLRFPYVKNIQADDLLLKCDAIKKAQLLEAKAFAEKIHENQQRIFERYQQLLRTPSAKLTADQKVLKERLKKGKSILVKAFSKKRNLPTLRSLYQSEAVEWIRILKPIWLCNPSQAARIFPMEKDLFTYGIFDEASQIPLENALGTIYRSKRIVVAGDSQQMSPSSFFKAGSHEKTDLLHQATFHWKSVPLSHHYRSEHPGLIQFSNKHFYQSSLKAFPSANADNKPVELHYVEGVYEQGVNVKEAQQVAQLLEQQIRSDLTIGVVAFSQHQLETIRTFLSPAAIASMEERIEQDTLFFKALENVQGDECDVLLISMGYGKDENGKFHMRFGPVNQSGGDKRLNVLFSRARKKIHVFTSVKSLDFKVSSNEGVELIRRYLQASENEEFIAVSDNFFQTHGITRNGNELLLKSPQHFFPNALEMVTHVHVLQQRGWNVRMAF